MQKGLESEGGKEKRLKNNRPSFQFYYSFQRQKEKNYRLIIQEDWRLDHSNFLF